MTKYKCDNSMVVTLVEKGIKTLSFLSKNDPSKKKLLSDLEKSLKVYKKDCSLCKGSADNDVKCLDTALTNLFRQLPYIKDTIYPWNNYDWDYSNFVDNNYSAKATKSTKVGSWSALRKNTSIFFKFFNALIKDANPNRYSVSGGMDKYSDFPIYGCLGNDKKNCMVWNKVKNHHRQKNPYNSKFFNKKLHGENSSSYFAKVGVCPRPDLKNSKQCIKNNHTWIPDGSGNRGKCFQNRYIYLDNSVKIMGNAKGYVPSVVNDVLSLSPLNLFNAFRGKNVDGHMTVQKCPKIIENYSNREERIDFLKIISILIIVSFILYYIRLR